MASVKELQRAQRAEGPATILAIGTATPANCFNQADYPDFHFRVTKSEHQSELKEKMTRICEKTTIKKRYLHLNEEILNVNPNMCEFMAPSLDERNNIVIPEVPKLAKAAALQAINEWGQPKSSITHLVFCAITGIDMPGADYRLTKLLGLRPSVKRFMMYQLGCYAGGTALRVAKDLAENNAGARVLVVCSEITASFFRGPSETHIESLIGAALFGDGAAAVIVGSDPDLAIERPLFQIVSADQTIVPGSEGAILGKFREAGLTFHLMRNVAELVYNNIEDLMVEAFSPLGINDWNSLFYIVHPGGPLILDRFEDRLGLKKEKLAATRFVLSEYGNILSASVLFILDKLRKRSVKELKATTGDGLEWGVLFGFGPGLTVETIVLRSVSLSGAVAEA